jgi:peptidyl-prolyl cis-trans isomerase SurA
VARIRKISVASLLLLAVPLVAPRPVRAEVLDKVVLRINDEIATLVDYQKRKAEMIDDINHRERDPAERQRLLGQAGEIVFKDLYEELLLRSRASQIDVEITDDQVDRAVQQLRESNGIKTEQEFQAALAQAGTTMPKLRERLRGDLRLREVLGKEVNSKIKVDEEDQRRYYRKHVDDFRVPEQVQMKEVVVLDTAVPSAEERARIAGEIKAAVAAGQPLEKVIEPYKAKGQVSAVTDLGLVSPGDLDPTLEKAAWSLQKGAVSAPVAGRGGLHVIQATDRHESHIRPFSEVAAAIQAKEEERVYRDKLAEYMADLQKQSLIVADPPAEAAGFRNLLGPVPASTDPLDPLKSTPPPPTPASAGAPATGSPAAAGTPAAASAAAAASPEAASPAPASEAKPDAPAPGATKLPTGPAPNTPGGLPTPKPTDPGPPVETPPPPR